MRYVFLFSYFFIFAKNLVFADTYENSEAEEKALRRVYNHLFIKDYNSAYHEAKTAIDFFPTNSRLQQSFIQSLFSSGRELEAIHFFHQSFKDKEIDKLDRNFLEEVAWGVVNKGLYSSQYTIRLASLVGAYTTQDIRAVKILLAMLKDNNAILRSIAVQLSCNYKDTILKKEIRSLLKEEKIWLVRLELIKAVGQMRIYEEKDFLQKVLVSQTSTFEEKTLAIQSLISLYETISKKEFNFLVKNPKAGVRQFACNLAFNLQIKEAKKIILSLLKDPHRDVRISSLNALGLFYIDLCSKKEVEVLIAPLLKDPDPVVAITAGWVALLIDSDNKNKITEWLECNQNEYRSLAAAAIAASGKKGVSIAKKAIKETKDPFVKVNLAIGLIGQREDIKKCCTELFSFIEKKDCMWMREKSKNPLFTVFSPSHIRHVDQIPNYPEAIDVLTQLELLSILAIFEGKKSAELIKKFLNNKIWQVTGVAAATLIKEGRDEALEIIRDLLKDENFQIRIQAAIILALYDKDENVISILEDAYANVDRDMKLYILEALGSIGMNKSFVFFLETLKEPFQVLRVIDAASLIRCLNH